MGVRWTVPGFVLGLVLVLAAPASATTFCVPAFHAACPDNGTNVAQADLQVAMQMDGADGIADTVRVDAGTFTDPGTLDVAGSDPLGIVGAGTGATRLTTSSNGNIIVVDLNTPGSSRLVTMRDLTVEVPQSVPQFGGLGIQAHQDALENVNVESVGHPHLIAVLLNGEGSYTGGRLYGAAGGGFAVGVDVGVAGNGTLALDRLAISNAFTGIGVNNSSSPITLARSRIDAADNAVLVHGGGTAAIENVLITDPAVAGVVAIGTSGSSSATVRHATIVRRSPSATANALTATVGNQTGDASVAVSASIMSGFEEVFRRQAQVSTTNGDASLSLSFSSFVPNGVSVGDGNLGVGPGNIGADPLLSGDFHLRPCSPAIDAVTVDSPNAPNDDIDGAPRPIDGDGDGLPQRDMGAFEFQGPPPPPAQCNGAPPPPPPATPSATAPTGERATALRKCKRKAKKRDWSKKRLKKCRKRAARLPE